MPYKENFIKRQGNYQTNIKNWNLGQNMKLQPYKHKMEAMKMIQSERKDEKWTKLF